MSCAQPKTTYLKDYQVPSFLVDKTILKFELEKSATLVNSQLHIRRNPASLDKSDSLVLQGVDLELISLLIDNKAVPASQYHINGGNLTLSDVPEQFVLTCETQIYPQKNTCLEGLYQSSRMYCTQCEAEGFRRITFYPDRPDVMSHFTTTIVADKALYPVLLSNGNNVESGDLDGGRHFVTWQDPFPKPSYLFALVAGDLVCVDDSFRTVSGRNVIIKMYVDAKNSEKCNHALASLKRAMRWDEKAYGREYDLDIFMIVAVDDFNMGAMENKGLNIFNSSCVLANTATATDATWQRIEGIVAHEYFHNWSGNRVTCRDWFQLSLKEGFTVFRDSSFSADMNSAAVKRIENVNMLRTAQFAEDAGPMAHPVRPASYIEISNFYTLTIYEKGAEVVGMLKFLLGDVLFRKGCDLYFQRHDGQAVTTDDFVVAMEEVSGLDLTQFRLWYSQAGTPVIEVSDHYNAAKKQYSLHFKQSCPPSPGQNKKSPFHIPVAMGLLNDKGNDINLVCQGKALDSGVLHLTEESQSFTFDKVVAPPTPSILRGFSAPVKLHFCYTTEQLRHLATQDSDQFNRWNAGQGLAQSIIEQLVANPGVPLEEESCLVDVYQSVIEDPELDGSIKSKMLQVPSEAYLIELAGIADVDNIHKARAGLIYRVVSRLSELFLAKYDALQADVPCRTDFNAMALREFKNTLLFMMCQAGISEALPRVQNQLASATNMTDEAGALRALANSPFEKERVAALAAFYQKWKKDAQVVEQWLSLQCGSPVTGTLAHVKTMLSHPVFDMKNPNKVRSVIGAFCNQSLIHFHKTNGEGYQFLADNVIELNALNPQIASRLITPLTHWKKFDINRQNLMKCQLDRILGLPDLSGDLFEVVSKSLKY